VILRAVVGAAVLRYRFYFIYCSVCGFIYIYIYVYVVFKLIAKHTDYIYK